jgi:hypothetical protein
MEGEERKKYLENVLEETQRWVEDSDDDDNDDW